MLSKKTKAMFEKQHYAIVGKNQHSAVQVCRWTKRSLLGEEECYKGKFYGIKSHQCCQMSPWLGCQNQCLHCWRAMELNPGQELEKERIDDPREIIDGCVAAQKKLLIGAKGNKKIDLKKFYEAQNPKHFAISLIGESTLYPRLAEFITELRKQGKTSFLVTNGLLPEKLQELQNQDALPTQLYVSLNYPDEKLFRKITQSKKEDSWKKLNETLELLKKMKGKTRTVIRITLVRELNMQDEMVEDYAQLIQKAEPDFIEIKGFMSIGFARKRLGYNKMPFHEEIKEFARKLLKFLKKKNYHSLDEKIFSRVVLLGKDKKRMKIRKDEI